MKAMILNLANTFSAYWRKAPKGKYLSFKEIAMYSVGGMGVQFVLNATNYIGLSAGSFLIGSAFGLEPMLLAFMGMASTIIGFVITPLRGMLIDNTRSKQGKYRPYLLTMGLPTVILSLVLVYLPFESMDKVLLFSIGSYRITQLALAVFIIFNLLQLFLPLFTLSYTNLVHVMSPNSNERTLTISVSSIIYSFAPTITGVFIPIIAGACGGLDNILTYRVIFPILCSLGVVVTMLAYFGTKERLVVSKKFVPKVGFISGSKKVMQNKYFWIINISGWVGFGKAAMTFIFGWMLVYGMADTTILGMDNYGIMAILQLILGTSALPAMAFATPLIAKFGKKNIVLASNIISVIAGVFMLLTFKVPLLCFIFIYFNGFASALQIVTGPAIGADILDYQQFKTGDRLDGLYSQIGGIIGSIIGLGTTLVIPAVQKYCGLNAEMQAELGVTKLYDVLYNTAVREDVFYGMLVLGLIGAILTTIPYFFYNLNESKHRNIIRVLKIRALFTDFSNEELSDRNLCDTVEEINEAKLLLTQEFGEISAERLFAKGDQSIDALLLEKRNRDIATAKAENPNRVRTHKICVKEFIERKKAIINELKAANIAANDGEIALLKAKLSKIKAEIKAERKAYKYTGMFAVKNRLIAVESAKLVINEMYKYSSYEKLLEVEFADKYIELNTDATVADYQNIRHQAESISVEEAKDMRKMLIKQAKRAVRGAKKSLRIYPNGIIEPDVRIIEQAYELPESTKEERQAKKLLIKKEEKELRNFAVVFSVLNEAKKIVASRNAYQRYAEIEGEYENAKQRVAEDDARIEAERIRQDLEHKEDLARIKQEKFNKLPQAKQEKIIAKRAARENKIAIRKDKNAKK